MYFDETNALHILYCIVLAPAHLPIPPPQKKKKKKSITTCPKPFQLFYILLYQKYVCMMHNWVTDMHLFINTILAKRRGFFY